MIRDYLKREAVFILSFAIILFFITVGYFRPDLLDVISSSVHAAILDYFSWLYLISASFFLLFSLYLAISEYGTVKLG